MNLKKTFFFLLLTFSTTHYLLSSTFDWPQGKVPAISIEQAIKLATTEALKVKKDAICIHAHLLGDEAQSGTNGTWNLYFETKEESFFIYIDMAGKVSQSKVQLFNLKK